MFFEDTVNFKPLCNWSCATSLATQVRKALHVIAFNTAVRPRRRLCKTCSGNDWNGYLDIEIARPYFPPPPAVGPIKTSVYKDNPRGIRQLNGSHHKSYSEYRQLPRPEFLHVFANNIWMGRYLGKNTWGPLTTLRFSWVDRFTIIHALVFIQVQRDIWMTVNFYPITSRAFKNKSMLSLLMLLLKFALFLPSYINFYWR
jgi:hypothetical protein